MASKEGTLTIKLQRAIEPTVVELGYDLVDVEFLKKAPPEGKSLLRLFIDRIGGEGPPIGIEDCVKVDRGLNHLIEDSSFDEFLAGGFTLEVSSPGIDRPLKTKAHFQRFLGQPVQLKTFRPLSQEEAHNDKYFEDHPRQKNFSGTIKGVLENTLLLGVDNQEVQIPLPLIAKANLNLARDYLASQGGNE